MLCIDKLKYNYDGYIRDQFLSKYSGCYANIDENKDIIWYFPEENSINYGLIYENKYYIGAYQQSVFLNKDIFCHITKKKLR